MQITRRTVSQCDFCVHCLTFWHRFSANAESKYISRSCTFSSARNLFTSQCNQRANKGRENSNICHVLHFLRANKGEGRWSYLACFALFVCKQGQGKMEIFGMFCTFCVQTRAREDGNIWHVLHFLRANKGEGRWSYLACFALFACKQGQGMMVIFGMFCTFCLQIREGKITIFGSEGKMTLISACLHINLSAFNLQLVQKPTR